MIRARDGRPGQDSLSGRPSEESLGWSLGASGESPLPPVSFRWFEPVAPGEPVRGTLAQLGPVRLCLLEQAHEQAQCNAYLASFHPLGYFKPISGADWR